MGDPALYVEALHAGGVAVLLDCGDVSALSPRALLRVAALGISHAHMDHWAGFDRLLRLLIGRERTLPVLGPEGFAARLFHRLQSYTWNLADRIGPALVFEVTEILAGGPPFPRTRLALRDGFRAEALPPVDSPALRIGPLLTLRAAVLDHGTPCLGFVLEEAAHGNIWRERLAAMGLPTGPWLTALKGAVLEGLPDDHLVAVPGGAMPLGALRGAVTVSAGQRIAYLTDFADTEANRDVAVALAAGADALFIEAPFLGADAAHALDRRHLTARAAGEIARVAGVRRVEPFHFSPRYEDAESLLLSEVLTAFTMDDGKKR